MMRILFLGDEKHPNAASWIEAMRSYGDVEVIPFALTDRRSKSFGRIGRTFEWLNVIRRIRRIIQQINPDVLIAYRTTSYGFLGAASGFHPLVIAMQGASDVWPLRSISTPFKRLLARYALRHADMIHAWGKHMAANSIELGADPDKILVLPRGIDSQRFYSPSIPQDVRTIRVVVTRSLFSEYRHDIILQAVRRVKELGRTIELHIVGEGVLRESLEQESQFLGIKNETHFHGRMDHARLPDLLRQCNIYVSMPLSEGVSASLFEAMACGCFPVVCNIEANRYWITHGENGFLVPLNDADALAARIIAVQDRPDLFEKARNINFSLIREKATLQRNISTFIAEYQRLMEEKK